jgi:RimJ/RimL family protein N-acetyltransferase
MSSNILETDRAIIRKLLPEDAKALAALTQWPLGEVNALIDEWDKHEKRHGFTVYGIILKRNNALYGYCGCREIMLHDRPEIEMLWYIEREFSNDPNDDLDYETAFVIRNYLFKKFNIKSAYAFVRENDGRNQNVAEEIDMTTEDSYIEGASKWLIYFLKSDSPKFLRSSGGDDYEPVRTSISNRRELTMNPAAKGRKPRLRPN